MEKTTGDYKTDKIKFVEFVGVKERLNLLSNQAYIMGNQLFGLMHQDLKFLIKIYPDGTIDFDEVDTNKTTAQDRKRFLEILEEKSFAYLGNKIVLNELKFTSVEDFLGKKVEVYLCVEYTKPMDRLKSILQEQDIKMDTGVINKLDSLLFDMDYVITQEHEPVKQNDDVVNIENQKVLEGVDSVSDMLSEKFNQLKNEKLKLLEQERLKVSQDIISMENQIKSINSKLSDQKNQLDILDKRISDFVPNDVVNGYLFYVTEKLNETIIFDVDTENKIKNIISKIKNINVDNFMKLFYDGEHNIYLSKITDSGWQDIESINDLPEEILNKVKFLISDTIKGGFIYRGDLAWGDIINKMLKLGFQQDSKFDSHIENNL